VLATWGDTAGGGALTAQALSSQGSTNTNAKERWERRQSGKGKVLGGIVGSM